MRARYLVRFDDLTPTMNWTVWEEIERILGQFSVAPILAVVPANRDPHLQRHRAHPQFWARVREWQDRGWTIGVHGYEHRYVTRNPGIVGLNPRSEFAGLPAAEQDAKLRCALEIFRREGVRPRVWIAPSHSFDATTVRLLLKTEVRIISDGFFLFPRVDPEGILWVPQQFWAFRRMPFGVWTVCLHHNEWTEEQVHAFRGDVRRFRDSIATLDEIAATYRDRTGSAFDGWIGRAMLASKRTRRYVQRLLRRR